MEGPIIVTGCQRSGTTFIAYALANKYKYSVWEDKDWLPLPDHISKLILMVSKGVDKLVIQSPTSLCLYHTLFHKIPNIHFVGVKRDKEDIVKSMERIKWMVNEYHHYIDFMYDHIQYMNDLWESLKRVLPTTNWTEVKYKDFEGDSLFVPAEDRKNFTVKQILPDKPVGPKYWKADNLEINLKSK